MNYYHSTYLMHHGIKGQKWGVRRFQNEDGSLTDRGRKRYGEMEDAVKERIYAEKELHQQYKSKVDTSKFESSTEYKEGMWELSINDKDFKRVYDQYESANQKVNDIKKSASSSKGKKYVSEILTDLSVYYSNQAYSRNTKTLKQLAAQRNK